MAIVGGGGGVTFHYIGRMAWSTSQVSTMDKYKYTSLYISLTPAHNRSGRIPNAKSGPKISKQLSRQAFGHYIRVLVGRRNMQYADLAQSDLLVDKVNINLDMLGAPMMNRIGRHVDCTHIVTINDSRMSNRDVELLKKLSKPATFDDSMGDDTVLSPSTGA
jgi:hypothetical protein